MKIPTFVAGLAALAAGTLSAQVGGGMGGASPPAGGTQAGVQTNPGSAGASRTPEVPRTIYLSGKVAMQDGSPVPRDVTIQRICSGVTHTVAYTDSRGRFSFQWNDRNSVVADASDAGQNRGSGASAGFGGAQTGGGGFGSDPFGSRTLMNCELRANLAGYTSDLINLFNRRLSDSPDVGMIVLHRIAGVEGTSVSATSLMAPKDARKSYERGLQSLAKNKPDEALKNFEKAVAVYPKYADAWVSLGKVREQQDSLEAARAALTKAVECDPKLVTPYVELGALSARESRWQESGAYLDQALRLDPVDFPQAWYTSAVANFNLRKYDAAEKAAREAVRLDPRHANPRSVYLLGLVFAEKQDYAAAAEQLVSYLKMSPNAPDLSLVRGQLEQFEKLREQNRPAPAAAQR